ncbi:NIPSNAP family protein [Streptomyces sp. NEAU-YJ-81]|uniref:NIPSNAP family protein n=1 Tax=Streptomyces sp. NEAU-YJ-81 TaxID=2820288 RepID=UPI001ABCBA76|nr:NIPSNAP family protein [Streptomyces sp. NEAU-YJ-81]MBO3678441.1 NIPSNAP family protein [Streptomyces sp. NEAU-YJ-81]
MFYEIRRYQIRPGRREEWVSFFEEVIIPFQESKGMNVIASFIDEEDPDRYVWMRRFADEAERERLYAAVYQSERWQQEIGPRVEELMFREKIQVTRAVPTPASGLR